MKKLLYLALLLGLVSACNGARPYAALITAKTKSLDTTLEFVELEDRLLCNSDSIIPSDCGSGFIHFRKDGKVIYEFTCIGDDSQWVDLGRYQITDSGVYCVFEQCYTYPLENFMTDVEEVPEPRPGKIRKQETWDLLIKTDGCPRYPWYVRYPEIQEHAYGTVFRAIDPNNS